MRQTSAKRDGVETPSDQTEYMQDSVPPRRMLAGKRILLVEDNRDVQLFVGGIARLERADITIVHTGEEALSVLIAGPAFDTILLDINLPGISGWEVLRSLRDEPPAWNEAPSVFIFTASAASTIETQAQELGAAGVITKPVSAKDLVQALAAAA